MTGMTRASGVLRASEVQLPAMSSHVSELLRFDSEPPAKTMRFRVLSKAAPGATRAAGALVARRDHVVPFQLHASFAAVVPLTSVDPPISTTRCACAS